MGRIIITSLKQNGFTKAIAIVTFLFFFLINSALCKNNPHIFIPTGDQKQPLAAQLEYLEDASGIYTIDQVASGQAGLFKPLEKRNLGFGYKKIMWVRFIVDLENYQEPYWFLTQNYEHVGDLTLFFPTSSSDFGALRLSESLPGYKRLFEIHNYLFKIPKPEKSSATYYMRFDPNGHALNIDLSWASTKGIIEYLHNTQLIMGLFFGGLLAMWFYNLVLCVYLRSRSYLYYIYYLGCLIATLTYLNGFAPLLVQLNTFYENLFATCAYCMVHGMTLFARHFLLLKPSMRRMDRYLAICQWMWLIGGIGTFFLPLGNPYQILNYLMLLTVPALAISGFMRAYQGYQPARIYSAGWTVLAISLAVYILVSIGILPISWMTNYALQIASVWEAILFALALAYRIKLADKAAALAKNAFLAMISHELRTPLQSIVSSIDLLSAKGMDKGKDDEVWHRLRSATEHLEVQVKDLTDYARLGSGKMQLRYTTFNASRIVKEIAEDLRAMTQQKGLAYEIDIEGSNLIVRSDALRIQQIVNNLVVNAIKYTETGYVKVRLRYLKEKTVSLVIQIEDSGIGINTKNMPMLFEPFTQADEMSTRRHGGIGMGLAIVQQLVSLLGGSITVTSSVGQGTKFEVRIPIEEVEYTDMDTYADDERNNRILLVDDTEDVRLSLKEIIEQLGYRCDAASNGREATDQIKLRRYAAILLDVNMPGMDGFSVAKEIRSIARNQHVPIIWISATTPQLSTKEQRKLFTHVLEKPVRKEKLRMMLQETLAA